MTIWQPGVTLDYLNERGKGTCSDYFGIRFTSLTEDSLSAVMPVRAMHKQPEGIVHGGVNVVLAETVASTAANAVIDGNTSYCVGLEINANHLRSVTKGQLLAVAEPIHLGRKTHVWQVTITDNEGKKTCVSRMTAAVLERK